MPSEPIITVDLAMLIRDLIAMGGRIAALEAEVKSFTSTNTGSRQLPAWNQFEDVAIAQFGNYSRVRRTIASQTARVLYEFIGGQLPAGA